MKLLLTSAGWWKNLSIGKEFIKLVGKKPSSIKVLLIITLTENITKNKYVKRQFRQFKAVKIPKENITFFQFERKVQKSDLKGFDVVFVFGGNTFEYLNAIRKTGLDKAIRAFVKRGGVYLGLSAGSYVVCPTIEAAMWKHPDRNVLGMKDLRGLSLVPFLITAHFNRECRYAVTRSALKARYPVIALTDRQAILVNGKTTQIIGIGKKNIFNTQSRF